jgi:hypothetical protein
MEHKIETLILRWWQSMFLSTEQLKEKGIMPAPSAHKAQLRRADSLDAVMLTAGFRALWLSLPEDLIADKPEEKVSATCPEGKEFAERFSFEISEIFSAKPKPCKGFKYFSWK